MAVDPPLTYLLNQGRPVLGVELSASPENEKDLWETVEAVSTHLRPDYVSITDKGSELKRQMAFLYAQVLRERFGWTVVAHLTCLNRSKDELLAVAESYLRMGVRNILCLRGDIPGNQTGESPLRHASELVDLLKAELPDLSLGVAGYPNKHPEARHLEEDIFHLKEKVDGGASWVTTQFFFEEKDYFSFVRKCREAKIEVPILPGIMPAVADARAEKIRGISGVELPAGLSEKMKNSADIAAAEADWAMGMIKCLLKGGAPGVHLCLLNKSPTGLQLLPKMDKL